MTLIRNFYKFSNSNDYIRRDFYNKTNLNQILNKCLIGVNFRV